MSKFSVCVLIDGQIAILIPLSKAYGNIATVNREKFTLEKRIGMQATVKWVDNAMFLGESGSGHSVVMDGPPDHGGRNLGVRPMEMLLLGMGGCASFDVIEILEKSVSVLGRAFLRNAIAFLVSNKSSRCCDLL